MVETLAVAVGLILGTVEIHVAVVLGALAGTILMVLVASAQLVAMGDDPCILPVIVSVTDLGRVSETVLGQGTAASTGRKGMAVVKSQLK